MQLRQIKFSPDVGSMLAFSSMKCFENVNIELIFLGLDKAQYFTLVDVGGMYLKDLFFLVKLYVEKLSIEKTKKSKTDLALTNFNL